MKFHFELTNLKVLDAVHVERLDITTEYTVAEFIEMTKAYPALIEAVAKMADPGAPTSHSDLGQ